MPREIEPSRSRFRTLITANPNHFGTLADVNLAKLLPVVEPKKADTGYEEIGCVSYSPERDRLEATIVIKRAAGYSGGPCTKGSLEWVRFYVDYGSGWVDVGVATAQVFDIPIGKDCAGQPDHPYVLVAGVPLGAIRSFCLLPKLPRVRAILSWEAEPTAGDPGYVPVWGEVQDDVVQIRSRRFLFPWDVIDVLDGWKVDQGLIDQLKADLDLPFAGLGTSPGAMPDAAWSVAPNTQPLPPATPAQVPFSVDKLARLYSPDKLEVLSGRAVDRTVAKLVQEPVTPQRFAFGVVQPALSGALSPTALADLAVQLQGLDIDWGSIIGLVDDGKADTSFEELECLGLDDRAGQLVATYRVKRPTGFSGPPCSAGSTEYVAFWADFDDDCRYTYLGTATVAAHDYVTMPASGLSYAAILPLDLTAYRRLCEEPGLHKVRAVLSWNTPPSTTDPDALPHWGNRLDTHVHVLPGDRYDGTAKLTIVGGVATGEIDPVTGVTTPVAHIASNGVTLDPRGCPFAGLVTVHGPTDPALAGTSYRLLVRDVTTGGTPEPVTSPFYVVDEDGFGSWVAPGAGGWLPWPVWTTNTLGVLGYIHSTGDDLWETTLELAGTGAVDAQRFQLDNTLNAASLDPANSAHLAFDPDQVAATNCGKFTQGMTIQGTFDARDVWLRSWTFSLLPFGLPAGALTTSVGPSTSEAPVGSTWSLDTTGLQPCGYVLRLRVSDRAVVNSSSATRSVPVDIGFCLE